MIDCFYHMRRWASGSLFNCRLQHIILCLPSSKPNGRLLPEVRPNPSPNAHVKLLPCESFQRLLNHTYPTSVALPSPQWVLISLCPLHHRVHVSSSSLGLLCLTCSLMMFQGFLSWGDDCGERSLLLFVWFCFACCFDHFSYMYFRSEAGGWTIRTQ